MASTILVAPDLKKCMDKRVFVQMTNRKNNEGPSGILRGLDHFLNLILAEAVDESDGQRRSLGTILIRGNSFSTIQLIGANNAPMTIWGYEDPVYSSGR